MFFPALCPDFGLGPARCHFSISIKVFLELTGCRRVYGWFGQSHEYFILMLHMVGPRHSHPALWVPSSLPTPLSLFHILDFIEGCGGKLEDLPAALGQNSLVEPDSKGTVAGISSEKDNVAVAGVNSEDIKISPKSSGPLESICSPWSCHAHCVQILA